MTNLDSVLKNRDITLLAKIHMFKAMVFPIELQLLYNVVLLLLLLLSRFSHVRLCVTP